MLPMWQKSLRTNSHVWKPPDSFYFWTKGVSLLYFRRLDTENPKLKANPLKTQPQNWTRKITRRQSRCSDSVSNSNSTPCSCSNSQSHELGSHWWEVLSFSKWWSLTSPERLQLLVLHGKRRQYESCCCCRDLGTSITPSLSLLPCSKVQKNFSSLWILYLKIYKLDIKCRQSYRIFSILWYAKSIEQIFFNVYCCLTLWGLQLRTKMILLNTQKDTNMV